jgi:hypothetical protein
MKKIILTISLVIAGLNVQAGGFHGYHHYRSWYHPSISFYYGASPYYSLGYSYPSSYYPGYASYAYYPDYNYDNGYARPNYAVGGTLLGALTGGLIGNSIHHQGWEGAGIGAAAGLLLGSLAEQGARTYERNSYVTPSVSYARPNYAANVPTVNSARTVPSAPRVESPATATYKPAGSMGGANSLFGR